MSVIVGPSTWWVKSKEAADYYARICPLGTILGDGSAVYCRAGGLAWIVAPNSTQISDQWASGGYNSTLIGTLCCICEWPNVCSRLISCGFNPCDWFIPDQATLFNGYNCRSYWDTFSPASLYWSSSEGAATLACFVSFVNGVQNQTSKSNTCLVRSVRCITL
jgi:hypothetical protein